LAVEQQNRLSVIRHACQPVSDARRPRSADPLSIPPLECAQPEHEGHTKDVTSALGFEALAPLRDDPGRAAILLDIDGTLAPIAQQPSEAQVPQATRQLLIDIARRYGAVACVSGRRASEARAMVSIGSISYLGSHGAELLRAGWTEAQLDPRLEDWGRRIHEFGRELDTADARRSRIRLEDKGAILAFHWRGAQDEEVARAAIDAIAARAQAAGLRTHWGRKVLEVRPPVQFDKGAGVAGLLEGLDVHAVMYVGDDLTDLDAFRAIARLAEEGRISHAIRVGVKSEDGPPEIVEEADLVVQGTTGVRELLRVLASA
jgi:trehalose 6-phosphate phosphatase